MSESFREIRARAEAHHGGAQAVDARLADLADARDPADLPDDRVLAEMAKRVFQAGFVWKIIESKWPGFEEAFDGFDVAVNSEMSEERLLTLLADTGIIRNKPKILAVRTMPGWLSRWPRLTAAPAVSSPNGMQPTRSVCSII